MIAAYLTKLPVSLMILTGLSLIMALLGGPSGKVFASSHHLMPAWSGIMLMAVLAVYWRVLRKEPAVFAVAWCALMALFIYMVHKPLGLYQYDLQQNQDTIVYYASHRFFPTHDEVGEAHQAPLYYLLAAIIYRLAQPLAGAKAAWELIADASFLCFSLFLLYAVAGLLRFVPVRPLAWAGIVLLFLWPGNLIHCARISNNILIYLSFMGCAYHFLIWRQSHSLTELNRALLWTGVGFAVQTTAVILPAAMVTITAAGYLKDRPPRQWLAPLVEHRPDALILKPVLPGLLAAVLGICLSYGRNLFNTIGDETVSVIFGTSAHETSLNFAELFTLNLKGYISFPYIVTNYEQSPVNNQFWGYFLRSLSFGQFVWKGGAQAVSMNILMLLMWLFLAGAAYYLRCGRKRPLETSGYFLIFLAFSIAAQATVKMLIHDWSPFWADARYNYAIVPFFLISYLYLLTLLRTTGRLLYPFGLAMLLAYGAFSLAHLYLQLAPMV